MGSALSPSRRATLTTFTFLFAFLNVEAIKQFENIKDLALAPLPQGKSRSDLGRPSTTPPPHWKTPTVGEHDAGSASVESRCEVSFFYFGTDAVVCAV